MGIFCEIRVNYPSEGEFLPGDKVSGSIKYFVNEETVFNRITVSLKGFGRVILINHRVNNARYGDTEPYVDIDQVDDNEKEAVAVPKELYVKDFHFVLPRDLPTNFLYEDSARGVSVKAKMVFYVRIKFQRSGLLQFTKRFKQHIPVRVALTPTISTEPFTTSKQFKLIKFGIDNTIDVKACIENPVIAMNGVITLYYEIYNNTNMNIEGVKVKVKETYVYKRKGFSNDESYRDVEGTSSKSGSIVSGATQSMEFKINLPPTACTVQNWKKIARDYFVNMKILLPMFSVDRELRIPVQIGDIISDRAEGFDPPPSYWNSMGEYEREWSADNDAED